MDQQGSTLTGQRRLIKLESGFAGLVSLIITILIFSPFWGQMWFSDVTTFGKNSDGLKLIFGAFCKAGNLSQLNGIDLGSFNGATEMMLRANLPMLYSLFIGFSILGRAISFEASYLSLYMVQMFGFVYCGIRLARKYFDLTRAMATLFALSSLVVVFISSWYISFYFAVTLSLPIFYFALKAYHERTVTSVLLASLPYVLGFCCGYVTLAVFLCGFSCLVMLMYAFFWDAESNLSPIKRISYCLAPVILAGLVVLVYYLEVLQYTPSKKTPLWIASEFGLAPMDFSQIFTFSKSSIFPIEGINTPYIGMAWLFILITFAISGKVREKLVPGKRNFLYVILTLVGVFFLISMCRFTPVFNWFYGLVPILGSMHLPIRYMLLIMPFFFLVLTVLFDKEDIPVSQKGIQILSVIVGGSVLYLVMSQRELSGIDKNRLILELILLFSFLIIYLRMKKSWASVIAILMCTLMMPMQYYLYLGQEIYAPKATIEARSILYSQPVQDAFDEYVGTLPPKALYKFAAYEMDGGVPEYIPNNYAWYGSSDYTLSNYSGYELHLGVKPEYLARFPWFDQMDWSYIADTRGDFMVLNPEMVAGSSEVYEPILDSAYQMLPLDSGHTMYKLKKFIPSYYTNGQLFTEDQGDSLDNGYFYSPHLSNEDILAFETNENSRFSITLQADSATDLGLLIHPNRYFHYYVDGLELEPIFHNDLAYIPVEAGEHQVEVRYENSINRISLGIFAVYYTGMAGVAVAYILKQKKEKLK